MAWRLDERDLAPWKQESNLMINLRRPFRMREAPVADQLDPLDHPDLKRMTLRELADLPMPRIGARQERGASSADARGLGDVA